MMVIMQSCATMFSGTKQTVSFSSDPPGAKVLTDGQEIGYTPITAKVKRKTKEIVFRKDGYYEGKIEAKQKTNPVYWWNLVPFAAFILPGCVFMWVDIGTGAAYKINDSYNVELHPKK